MQRVPGSALLALTLMAGCTGASGASQSGVDPTYLGVETRLLDGDLVNFIVRMQGVRGPEPVETYALCAAAQYTLIRGFGFARHLRTNVDEQGGIWTADAVYTISAALPRGLRTIDAEVTVGDCAERQIPTV